MTIRKKIEQLRLIGIKYVDHPDFAGNAKAFIEYDPYSDPDAFEPSFKCAKDVSSNNLTAYLASLYEYKVLTRQAEAKLFLKYNYLKYKAACLLELSPTTKRLKLIESYLESALRVRNIIITHNLRLVVSIVKKWRMTNEKSLEEWISDGNLWMITAIDAFDPKRGYKFSTYLSRALVMNSWRRKRDALPMANDELVENLTITDAYDPFDQIEITDSVIQLHEAIKLELDQRETDILSRRFGLRGHEAETLRSLSSRYGITMEWVRQIEMKAIDKLRDRVG